MTMRSKTLDVSLKKGYYSAIQLKIPYFYDKGVHSGKSINEDHEVSTELLASDKGDKSSDSDDFEFYDDNNR